MKGGDLLDDKWRYLNIYCCFVGVFWNCVFKPWDLSGCLKEVIGKKIRQKSSNLYVKTLISSRFKWNLEFRSQCRILKNVKSIFEIIIIIFPASDNNNDHHLREGRKRRIGLISWTSPNSIKIKNQNLDALKVSIWNICAIISKIFKIRKF